MHEQNILMELRHGIPTKRFWHRDLGGFRADNDLRRLVNKGLEALPAHIHLEDLENSATYFTSGFIVYFARVTGVRGWPCTAKSF